VNSLGSEADLITIPLFLVTELEASTGLISIAKDAGLSLVGGSLKRNKPAMSVAFLSQLLPLLRNCLSLP